MKIALWVEEGRRQIVLTPDTDYEKTFCETIFGEEDKLKISVQHGAFYRCQGGWTRESNEKESVILVIEGKKD